MSASEFTRWRARSWKRRTLVQVSKTRQQEIAERVAEDMAKYLANGGTVTPLPGPPERVEFGGGIPACSDVY